MNAQPSAKIPAHHRVAELAKLIMYFEGWKPGSRSWINNNPGNLVFANQTGTNGRDEKGFAKFPTLSAGYSALFDQLYLALNNKSRFYNRNMTLLEFFSIYAPRRTDHPTKYAAFVATGLGVTPTTQLCDL